MSRIPPKPSTIKKLFALSGNECAMPNCKNKLVNEDGDLIAQVCHIEAAEKGGPRYNENQTDEERRDLENLILLCANHHIETDNIFKYTTERLKKIKKNHESKYSKNKFEVSESTINKTIESIMKQENNLGSGTQINNQSENINIGTQIGTQNIYNTSNKIEEIIDYGKDYRKVIKTYKEEIDFEVKNYPPEDIEYYKDKRLGNKRYPVYHIPIKLLKLRKHNGRIKADVKSFEKRNNREIDEIKEQNLLKDFLINNDKVQSEKLKTLIETESQREPAIITCDGFLVNGNRRRAIFEDLYWGNDQAKQFATMKVVVLDEKVALIDIEKIENRFQLQDEGKSEYSGINRALSIRDKENDGYTLEAQLRDDPLYGSLKGRAFNEIVKEYKSEYLHPLEIADKYLDYFGNEGLYELVTESIGSKEGRWQAIKEFSKFYHGVLLNDKRRRKASINKEDVGKIEDIAYKLIRKRELGDLGSLYNIIRKLKDYMSNSESKKHLLRIVKNVDTKLPPEEMIDKETKQPIDERTVEKTWGQYFKHEIMSNLHQAHRAAYIKEVQEKPLDYIKSALKKLENENLIVENIGLDDLNEAINITGKIQRKAEELYEQLDNYRGKLKKLSK